MTNDHNREIISKLMLWLETEINNNNYADIGFTLSLHAGKITRYEKTIKEKLKGD